MATNSINTGRDFFHLLIRYGSEVIQIGVDGARIVHLSAEGVDYVDDSGQERAIDFRECAGNWVRSHLHRCFPAPQPLVERSYAENRFIGLRGSRWVKFMNRRNTLFEFPVENKWRGFVYLIDQAGWRTFDSDAVKAASIGES